eukprot:4263730-Prymnesium_polylepis.2
MAGRLPLVLAAMLNAAAALRLEPTLGQRQPALGQPREAFSRPLSAAGCSVGVGAPAIALLLIPSPAYAESTYVFEWDGTDYYYAALAVIGIGYLVKNTVVDLIEKAKAADEAKEAKKNQQ